MQWHFTKTVTLRSYIIPVLIIITTQWIFFNKLHSKVVERTVLQWVDGWLKFFFNLYKHILKANTLLHEATMLQKITTCNPSSKCSGWPWHEANCIHTSGCLFFFFHSGRVNPHTSEGKDVRKKIASLLHKITVIPKAEPCPVSLGSVCPRINRMPEPRQSCGDRENEINQMFSTDAPAWMSCVPQG